MFQRMNLNTAFAAGAGTSEDHSAEPWYRKALDATRSTKQSLTVALLGLAIVSTSGVLNGGTVPPTSPFSPLKTWLQTSFLGSDWVIMLGLVALIALVWGLAHGKGWGPASLVLGVISVPIVGPNAIAALATATRAPVPMVQKADESNVTAAAQAKAATSAGTLVAKSTKSSS